MLERHRRRRRGEVGSIVRQADELVAGLIVQAARQRPVQRLHQEYEYPRRDQHEQDTSQNVLGAEPLAHNLPAQPSVYGGR